MCTMSNDPGCFSLENGAHTSSVSSSSDHAEVSDLEGDDVLDFVGGKVQLDAVVHLGSLRGDDPVVLASLVDLNDVHEAGGELGVSPGLAIDLDQTLLHDGLNLLHGDGILQAVPEEEADGEALTLLVGAGAG